MSDSAPIEHPKGLMSGDFTEAPEPLRLFATWFDEAGRAEPSLPEAMTLATVDPQGLPNARMVLLKDFDERGFVFYSNQDSQKGQSWTARRKRPYSFIGSRSIGKCDCAVSSKWSRTLPPTLILRRDRGLRRSV